MNTQKHIKSLILVILLCLPIFSSAPANANSTHNTQVSTMATGKKSYAGYEVDGRTSASVLAAKRSHSVSKQDENGLAIFSGVFVICLIVFFTQALSKKK